MLSNKIKGFQSLNVDWRDVFHKNTWDTNLPDFWNKKELLSSLLLGLKKITFTNDYGKKITYQLDQIGPALKAATRKQKKIVTDVDFDFAQLSLAVKTQLSQLLNQKGYVKKDGNLRSKLEIEHKRLMSQLWEKIKEYNNISRVYKEERKFWYKTFNDKNKRSSIFASHFIDNHYAQNITLNDTSYWMAPFQGALLNFVYWTLGNSSVNQGSILIPIPSLPKKPVPVSKTKATVEVLIASSPLIIGSVALTVAWVKKQQEVKGVVLEKTIQDKVTSEKTAFLSNIIDKKQNKNSDINHHQHISNQTTVIDKLKLPKLDLSVPKLMPTQTKNSPFISQSLKSKKHLPIKVTSTPLVKKNLDYQKHSWKKSIKHSVAHPISQKTDIFNLLPEKIVQKSINSKDGDQTTQIKTKEITAPDEIISIPDVIIIFFLFSMTNWFSNNFVKIKRWSEQSKPYIFSY